jgi:hypothetical protein
VLGAGFDHWEHVELPGQCLEGLEEFCFWDWDWGLEHCWDLGFDWISSFFLQLDVVGVVRGVYFLCVNYIF